MNGNPECDCWDLCLWYLCCGREEWYALMEAQPNEQPQEAKPQHFSEKMLHPTASLNLTWMDDVADSLARKAS